jgi:hypothetical protein
MNNTSISPSKTIPQNSDHDHENNGNTRQRSPPSPSIPNDASTTQIKHDENRKKPKPRRRNKNRKQSEEQKHTDKPILSDDAKRRAQILLEKLTRAIENRSKQSNSTHTYSHSSPPTAQHHENGPIASQRSSRSSHDPFTAKLPPRSQRSSLAMNKNPHTMDNDTS